jgi:hypothetical protein
MSLNPYVFAVPPDDHLEVRILFNGFWENSAILVNIADPQKALLICNNYTDEQEYPRTFTFHNTQPTAQVFKLHCTFKEGPPNEGLPWLDSQPVSNSYTEQSIDIYEYTVQPRVLPNIEAIITLGTGTLPPG